MRSYYLIARDDERVRLYIGDHASWLDAVQSLEFNSRDWRVGSI